MPMPIGVVMNLNSEIKPYYQADGITLYHANSIDNPELWAGGDVMVSDPPYGIKWRNHWGDTGSARTHGRTAPSRGINVANDDSLDAMYAAIHLWGDKPALLFSSPLKIPEGTKQILVWWKNSGGEGIMGQINHWRRDWEAINLLGEWQEHPHPGLTYSSIIETHESISTLAKALGHPTPKPISLMETLIQHCPDGVIVDPFAGTGSTLLAARNLGRRCIGVELDERHCETSARRLSQMTFDLDFGEVE